MLKTALAALAIAISGTAALADSVPSSESVQTLVKTMHENEKRLVLADFGDGMTFTATTRLSCEGWNTPGLIIGIGSIVDTKPKVTRFHDCDNDGIFDITVPVYSGVGQHNDADLIDAIAKLTEEASKTDI